MPFLVTGNTRGLSFCWGMCSTYRGFFEIRDDYVVDFMDKDWYRSHHASYGYLLVLVDVCLWIRKDNCPF